jgi:hypothetical protein
VLEQLARRLWLVTGVSGLLKTTRMLDDAKRSAEEKEYRLEPTSPKYRARTDAPKADMITSLGR